MQPYKNRQIGTIMIIGLGSAILLTLYYLIQFPTGTAKTITALISALLILCLLLFWSLTVEINPDHIHVYFGFGIIHRRIPYSKIKQVNVVRTPWYYGWGIRSAPHGWMFNVSGLGGVEIVFKNKERFRIGSNQPNQLYAAIQQRLSKKPGNDEQEE